MSVACERPVAAGHEQSLATGGLQGVCLAQNGDRCVNDEQTFAGHRIVIVRRAADLFFQLDGGALVPNGLEASVSGAKAESLKAVAQSACKVLIQRQVRSSPMPSSR